MKVTAMVTTRRRVLLACLFSALYCGAVWAAADEFPDVVEAERGLKRGNEVFEWQARVSANASELLMALREVSVHINATSSKAAKMQNNSLKTDVEQALAGLEWMRKDAEAVAQNVESMKGTVPKDEEKIRNEIREVVESKIIRQFLRNKSTEEEYVRQAGIFKGVVEVMASLWGATLSGISLQLSEAQKASSATSEVVRAAAEAEARLTAAAAEESEAEKAKEAMRELEKTRGQLNISVQKALLMVTAATTVEANANEAAKAFGEAARLAAKSMPSEQTLATKKAAPDEGRAALLPAESCFLAVSHCTARLVLFFVACVTATTVAA